MTVALLPGARAVRLTDAIAATSVVIFVALGVVVGVELARLAELGTGLEDTAAALERTGRALDALGGLPIVGGQVSGFAGSVLSTAADVRSGGAQAAATVRALAVAVAVTVAFVPSPMLAAYLPFRARRARALRELRQLVGSPRGSEPALAAQLAHRAALCLPYTRLKAVSPDPWADLAAGRHRALAAAELERLGLTPPAGWTAPRP